jgi:hypothetical protein
LFVRSSSKEYTPRFEASLLGLPTIPLAVLNTADLKHNKDDLVFGGFRVGLAAVW